MDILLVISSLLLCTLGIYLTLLYLELNKKVDYLEKQIAHILKTSVEFFCATNNRISDISTAFDCCDDNIDTLFDVKDNIIESITDLKRSVECVNCKL